MSIFSKAASAVKNVATKAVSAVKSALGYSAITTPNRQVSSGGLTYSAKDAPTISSTNFNTVSPVNINKANSSGGLTYSPSLANLTSTNTPSNFSASEISSDVGTFDTPSYVSPNTNVSSYLTGSNYNSGSTIGTPSSTVGASAPMSDLEKENKKREEEVKKSEQNLIDMMNELAGKPKEQTKLESEVGLPQANSELRDLQAKQTLQTAQYMQEVQDIQNKPIAMEFIAGQQGEVARRAGIDAMITSALIQGKEGQIKTSQETVDRALKLKYDPIITRIDTQKAILEMNYNNLSRSDKKVADARTSLLDLQKTQTSYDRDIRKSLMDNIYKGISDGTIDSSAGYAQIENIVNENTKLSDVFKSMGITGEGNPGLVNGYDITSYATDPNHETKINAIVNGINITNSSTAQEVINKYAKNSPITGSMIINSANKYKVDPNVMFALMLNDSSLGTAGKAVRTLNPGNVGNDDAGNTRTYSSWGAGVDGVAEWLSKHKAKAVYNGEFEDVIFKAASYEPEKAQGRMTNNLKKSIANGKWQDVYTQIGNSTAKALTGENKTQYTAKKLALPTILKLKNDLQAYEDAGGKTGLLKGTYEKIYSKLGEVSDPKYKQLATDLRISLQNYRKEVSGAAFSDQESADYESVNAAGTNTLALNSSILDGMYSNFQRQVYSAEETILGEGVKEIRNYANGVDPLLTKMNNAVIGNNPTVSNSEYFNNLP